ncbi:MAG: MFS transporter [Solirubrobacterales bacterium]|nr:MFS transporter [Solirubrobacterales bacterium]
MQTAIDPAQGSRSDALGEALDEAPFGLMHVKAAVTAGMGFFTDGYDLNVIAMALIFLKPQFYLNSGQTGLLSSTALIAAFIGAFVFGRGLDMIGRKRIYGLEAMIMVVGAVASAFAPNFTVLLIARFILGIGIGGDYPTSAVIMTEYANRKSRGQQVALMFLGYTLGQLAGPLVAVVLIGAGVDHNLVWRLLLGLGALPALAVVYSRRKMPESPRYVARVQGERDGAVNSLNKFSDGSINVAGKVANTGRMSALAFLRQRHVQLALIGTAGAWFFADVSDYGNSLSAPLILKALEPAHAGLTAVPAITFLIYAVCGLPGALVGLRLIDRGGRRNLQLASLVASAVCLCLLGLIPGVTKEVVPFAVIYGVATFTGSWWGATTMVLAAEYFATAGRGTGHGLSAGSAKVGAYLGALIFPSLLSSLGLGATELIAGGIYLLGALCTLVLREPSGKSLDDLSGELSGADQTVASPPAPAMAA